MQDFIIRNKDSRNTNIEQIKQLKVYYEEKLKKWTKICMNCNSRNLRVWVKEKKDLWGITQADRLSKWAKIPYCWKENKKRFGWKDRKD